MQVKTIFGYLETDNFENGKDYEILIDKLLEYGFTKSLNGDELIEINTNPNKIEEILIADHFIIQIIKITKEHIKAQYKTIYDQNFTYISYTIENFCSFFRDEYISFVKSFLSEEILNYMECCE